MQYGSRYDKPPSQDQPRDYSRSSERAPQIYYKKDQSRVVYEDGQDTYRGPEGFAKQLE